MRVLWWPGWYRGKTVFVFPARAHSGGDGRCALSQFPVFAQAFDEAAAMLEGHMRLPLRDVMWVAPPSWSINRVCSSRQFSPSRSLAALLQHWGVVPDVVLGHSAGEITAAYWPA